MVKMRMFSLFIAGALILSISSCHPKSIKSVPNVHSAMRPPQPMVQHIVTTDNSGNKFWEHFYYDSLWRLSSTLRYYINMDYNLSENYTYKPDNTKVVAISTEYTLANGLAVFETLHKDSFAYNANGYLVHLVQPDAITDFYYSAGNNEDSNHLDGKYTGEERIYYDEYFFYNNRLNTIGNYNKGLYMMGHSSANLPEYSYKKMHRSTEPPATEQYDFTVYTYQYNDSGWVSHRQVKTGTISKTSTGLDTFYVKTDYDYIYY